MYQPTEEDFLEYIIDAFGQEPWKRTVAENPNAIMISPLMVSHPRWDYFGEMVISFVEKLFVPLMLKTKMKNLIIYGWDPTNNRSLSLAICMRLPGVIPLFCCFAVEDPLPKTKIDDIIESLYQSVCRMTGLEPIDILLDKDYDDPLTI